MGSAFWHDQSRTLPLVPNLSGDTPIILSCMCQPVPLYIRLHQRACYRFFLPLPLLPPLRGTLVVARVGMSYPVLAWVLVGSHLREGSHLLSIACMGVKHAQTSRPGTHKVNLHEVCKQGRQPGWLSIGPHHRMIREKRENFSIIQWKNCILVRSLLYSSCLLSQHV